MREDLAWQDNCQTSVFRWGLRQENVSIMHLPTGRKGWGNTKAEALASLASKLVADGYISINEARKGLQMPPWEL